MKPGSSGRASCVMQEFTAFHGTSAPAGIDDFYLSWTREKVFWYQDGTRRQRMQEPSAFPDPLQFSSSSQTPWMISSPLAQPSRKVLGSPATSKKALISCCSISRSSPSRCRNEAWKYPEH